MINISYLNVPLEYGNDFKIKNNMWITAKPFYKNVDIEFEKLRYIFSSDYKQYSPFNFIGGIKKSDNWDNKNQNILVLDIDDGLTIKEAYHKFKEYENFICTTKSHRVEKKGVICDRFRIILKCKNVPIGDEYFDYMNELKELYPFIDEQVNTKTGSFLGCSNCKFWYNKGKEFDFKILKPISIPKKIEHIQPKKNYENEDLGIDKIKQLLTQEVVRDILNANGFDVDRNFKLKLREERTPSTSISRDCLIKDFGSDFAGDVFEVLMTFRNMNFIQSVDEVKKYV